MNRFCNACNINIDKINYLKYKTVRKSCYNENRRKNNRNTIIGDEICTELQQPKVDEINNNNVNNPSVSTNENHRHVIVGPSNAGKKKYYMLKVLEKLAIKDQFIK